jgi:RNA polymerase sigma-70 factor (ECF subfamily)
MEHPEIIPHLFRTEFSKITSVLCKLFGLAHIETAEDIASETFLAALETWPYKGIPENPVAWLYTVAKNKTRNKFARDQIFIERIAPQIKQATTPNIKEIEIDLSEKNISDSLLQMLFVVCHPAISIEAQIALSLKILCGFSVEEIANAFLSNKEAINKRLYRAKETLRKENINFVNLNTGVFSEPEMNKQLETVLTTLYLLYNEGYYSESNDSILREDLCREAMRLTFLLIENNSTNLPNVNALYSLMCFHASRFAARKNESGEIILYDEQDVTLWDQELISKGAYFLTQASTGNEISKYHLEANIAYWHTVKNDSKEKWENILQLYNLLLQTEYSPIAALNRTFALSKVSGEAKAIQEAEKLQLKNSPYYFALLGELYANIDDKKSIDHFQTAYSLAKNEAEKNLLKRKIKRLNQQSNKLD